MSNNKKVRLVSSPAGQALLEVLASMSLIIVMSITLLGICMQSSRWVSETRLQTQAACLSYSIIELLRAGTAHDTWLNVADSGWVQAGDLGLTFMLPDNMNAYINVGKTTISEHLFTVGVKAEWYWRNEKRDFEIYTQMRDE